MPKGNQRSVTLNVKVYLLAKMKAEKDGTKSVAGYITKLILGA